MGVNVAALLVLAALLVMLTVLPRASIVSHTLVSLNMREAADRAGERARTNFSIQSATVTGGGADLTLQVKNEGLTSVSDFAAIDFIVDYTDVGSAQVIARLTYTAGALGNNQWKKTSISPAVFEPGAWNPGETMTLDAKLSPAQRSCGTGMVAVATPNGVSAAGSFPAGVVCDASSSAQGTGTLTWSHTVTGSNTFLFVGICNDREPVTGVTYGGQALTFLANPSSVNAERLEIWYKTGPLTGTNNIVVTVVNQGIVQIGGAQSWTGVDQTTPLGTAVTGSFDGVSPSLTVTSATGEVVLDSICTFQEGVDPIVGAGQTQRWNLQSVTNPSYQGAGSSEPGAASVIMSWTVDGGFTGAGAVPIKPAP